MLTTIISFVVVMSILVFVHELGHLLVARRSGIIVEEFGFGYPPRVRTLFHWKGIPITLNAIPFGGFARMKGEDGAGGDGSFTSVSKRARAATLLAGSGMNFLMAIFRAEISVFLVAQYLHRRGIDQPFAFVDTFFYRILSYERLSGASGSSDDDGVMRINERDCFFLESV